MLDCRDDLEMKIQGSSQSYPLTVTNINGALHVGTDTPGGEACWFGLDLSQAERRVIRTAMTCRNAGRRSVSRNDITVCGIFPQDEQLGCLVMPQVGL